MSKHSEAQPWYTRTWARWLAVILWMGVIFAFSAQPTLPRASNDWLDFLVKKGAHFSVFAFLSVLIWQALYWRERGWSWAWVITLLYAISDEWHQSFVPGRNPALRDVVIDACGAATALLIFYWLRKRSPEPQNPWLALRQFLPLKSKP
jgi:VanZ family protein